MTAKANYLAVDLGASSGRVLSGSLLGSKIEIGEGHRFHNGPVRAGNHLYWDALRLWSDIQDGLRSAASECSDIRSVGIDTWGVDFALLGRNDELLGNPLNYRDPHTNGMLAAACDIVSREEIFDATGLQFMEINTLYQLFAMSRANSPILEAAETFLMIPDLFHWLLCGEKANELTDVTTTQFYDPRNRDWAKPMLERLGIPTAMFGNIVQPGTKLGQLKPDVRENTGLGAIDVVLPGTHDTASAVMAVPARGEPTTQPDWCYISSGTWSLMGVEVAEPIINDRCRELNFTNEGGVGGTTRVLKNIGGLWLVQECQRIWARDGKDYSWSELVSLSEQAPPLETLIDPDNARFVAPANMAEEIAGYCSSTNQPTPQSHGAIIRTALESLAMKYRMVLGWLEQLTGSSIKTIHIVGGGTQNEQLCQMTADACNRAVIAGPVEATAIGNVMMQAIASGEVASISQAREIIGNSFEMKQYEPKDATRWDDGYSKFEALVSPPT